MGRMSHRLRRGVQAVEFALVAPVLVLMIGGIVDYGWFFWKETLVTNALREAVRAGSLKRPDKAIDGVGECAACITAAADAAELALKAQGYSGITLTPTLERMPASGTPCSYALVLEPEVPHTHLMSLVPGPKDFRVRVVSMAQAVACE